MTPQNSYFSTVNALFEAFLKNSSIESRSIVKAKVLLTSFLSSTKNADLWNFETFQKFVSDPRRVQMSDQELIELVGSWLKQYPPHQSNVALHHYLLALKSDGCSDSTIKNYRSDIGQYLQFVGAKHLNGVFIKPKIVDFLLYQRQKGLKKSSARRKLASITQFGLWAEQTDYLLQPMPWLSELGQEFESAPWKNFGSELPGLSELQDLSKSSGLSESPGLLESPLNADKSEQTLGIGRNPIDSDYKYWVVPLEAIRLPAVIGLTTKENQTPGSSQETAQSRQELKTQLRKNLSLLKSRFSRPQKSAVSTASPYLSVFMIALFLLGGAFLAYRQFGSQAETPLAYPTSLTRPNRTLSFQGRLTDSAKNPITTSTDMRFRLYDNGPSTAGGNLLWDSGTCGVTPDQDGIFSTGLGDDCGSEISDDVFTENSNVWLQVEIDNGVTWEVLDPRQSIKTVPYALNSETLQGFPASMSAVENTVLVMDNNGDVVLGSANPTLRATGDSFTIEAQSLTLQTSSGSDGDIILSPDGLGEVFVNSDLTSTGYISAPGATLSATYAGGTALVARGGPSGTANIQEWQNSSGTALTTVNNLGHIGIGGNISNKQLSVVTSAQNNFFSVDTTAQSEIVELTGAIPRFIFTANRANGTAPVYQFRKSRGSNQSPTIVQSGDGLGVLDFQGYSGTDYRNSARIYAQATGTINSNYVGSDIIFMTENSAAGGSLNVLEEVMRLTSAGNAEFTSLSAGGLVKAAATTGRLQVATAGTDYEVPLTFTNGLTRSTNTISLGGALTSNTDIDLDGNDFSFSGTGFVGIGTNTPAYELDLNGDINLTGAILIAGDAGTNGYLLTSSAGGAMTWTDPSTLGGGTSWWDNTDNVLHPIDEYASVADLVIGGNSTSSANIHLLANGSAVFNQQGNDADFRVEGSGQPNALFVQGSDGHIGLGTNAPAGFLHLARTPNWYDGSPTLAFGDGDTGIYEQADDNLLFTFGGVWRWHIDQTGFYARAGGVVKYSGGFNSTNPIFSNAQDLNSGLSFGAADQIHLVTGGVPRISIDSSGNTDISSLTAGGLVKAAATTGRLQVATAGTDYELPITFENGLTRSSNTVSLGGTLTGNTDIDLDGNDFTLSGTGNVGIGTNLPNATLTVTNTGQSLKGKSVAIFDQHEDEDILTASASGATRLRLANDGNLFIEKITDTSNDNYFLDPAAGGNSLVVAGSVGIGVTNPSSFKLQIAGSIGPNADDTYDLGSSTARWRDLYLGPGSLHIGTNGNSASVSYDASNNYLAFDPSGSSPTVLMHDNGDVDLSTLSAGGLVKAAATTGRLQVATAGTDYEVPLTFTNGLTRSSNTISLGGSLTGNTSIALAGNDFSFTGSGNVALGDVTSLDQRLVVDGAIRIGDDATSINTLADADILAGGSNGIFQFDESAGSIFSQYSLSSSAAHSFNARKSRGNSGSQTAVSSGDDLFNINAYGMSTNGTYALSSQIKFDTEGTISGGRVPGIMRFYTSSSTGSLLQRIQIDSNGDVAIGTTTTNQKVNIAGNLNITSSGNTSGLYIDGAQAVTGQTSGGLLYLNNAGSFGTGVYANGNLYSSGLMVVGSFSSSATSICRNLNTLATCSSLSKFKDNQQNLSLGLDTLMQLRPVEFDWNINDKQHDLGFIAEEIEAINPLLAEYGGPGGELSGVKYSHMTALIVKGVQEQQAQIEKNKNKLKNIASLPLDERGLVVLDTTSNEYKVTVKNKPINSLLAAAEVISAKIQAGFVATKELTAQVADIQNLKIGGVPINQYIADVVGNMQTPQITQDEQETTVNSLLADLMVSGDATISGKLDVNNLVVDNLQINSLEASSFDANTSRLGSLLAESATVSGTLTAGELMAASVSADTILTKDLNATSSRIAMLEAHMAELYHVKAQTADLMQATVSGTLYANNIYDFENKIASSFEKPGLIDILKQKLTPDQQSQQGQEQEPDPTNPQTVYESVGMYSFEASSSADLDIALADLELDADDVTLTAQALFLDQYFKVNGAAYVADSLGVGKQILVGSSTTIADGSINYAAPDGSEQIFQIQPSGTGSISLLAGLVVMDESGQVEINGSLKVAGNLAVQETLLSNLVQPLDFGNPFQVQVAGISDDGQTVRESRFEIIDEIGTPVATISAQGRAAFASGIDIGADKLSGDGENPTVDTDKSSGKAKIPAGSSEITIKTKQITKNTLIYITPIGSTNNQVMYVKSQTAQSSDHDGKFVVGFDEQIESEVSFNWWLVN